MKQKLLDYIDSEDSLFELLDISLALLHNHMPIAVVDLENQYRCATNGFTHNVVGKPKKHTIGKTAHDFTLFDGHAQKIFEIRKNMKPGQVVTWLRIHDYPSGRSAHLVTETAVINPLTQKIFAIQCSGAQQININHLVHSLIKAHKQQFGECDSFTVGAETNLKLGVIQEEVLFCLLLGFKGYKFIADFINSIKQTKYTDVTVRNAINGLYSKFEAEGNINLLIQKAIYLNLHTYIPKGFLNAGSTLISIEEMPLGKPVAF